VITLLDRAGLLHYAQKNEKGQHSPNRDLFGKTWSVSSLSRKTVELLLRTRWEALLLVNAVVAWFLVPLGILQAFGSEPFMSVPPSFFVCAAGVIFSPEEKFCLLACCALEASTLSSSALFSLTCLLCLAKTVVRATAARSACLCVLPLALASS
jgi:hypothetical protein